MTKDETLSLRVTPDLKARVEQAAADDGRSVSNFVARLLEAHLASKE